MKRRISLIMLAASLALAGCNLNDATNVTTSEGPEFGITTSSSVGGNSGLPGRATVLRLLGTAIAYEAFVPDIDGDGKEDAALCFDVDLLDASGKKIGTATDCLSNIKTVDSGLALVGTTIFHLPNGTFITRGNTTVQPVTTTEPTPVTHTTGAIPFDGANGVIYGDKAFRTFRAQARLSGAVNLSRLDSDGEITFDCLFAIMPLGHE